VGLLLVAVLLLLVLVPGCAASWQEQAADGMRDELESWSDEDVAQMCGALVLLGIDSGSDFLYAGSSLGLLDSDGWDGVPDGVTPVEFANAAWVAVEEMCNG